MDMYIYYKSLKDQNKKLPGFSITAREAAQQAKKGSRSITKKNLSKRSSTTSSRRSSKTSDRSSKTSDRKAGVKVEVKAAKKVEDAAEAATINLAVDDALEDTRKRKRRAINAVTAEENVKGIIKKQEELDTVTELLAESRVKAAGETTTSSYVSIYTEAAGEKQPKAMNKTDDFQNEYIDRRDDIIEEFDNLNDDFINFCEEKNLTLQSNKQPSSINNVNELIKELREKNPNNVLIPELEKYRNERIELMKELNEVDEYLKAVDETAKAKATKAIATDQAKETAEATDQAIETAKVEANAEAAKATNTETAVDETKEAATAETTTSPYVLSNREVADIEYTRNVEKIIKEMRGEAATKKAAAETTIAAAKETIAIAAEKAAKAKEKATLMALQKKEILEEINDELIDQWNYIRNIRENNGKKVFDYRENIIEEMRGMTPQQKKIHLEKAIDSISKETPRTLQQKLRELFLKRKT